MKTKYILFMIALLLGFSSCSNNDEGSVEPTPESSEMVTVSLALSGEITTSEQPLSRAEVTSSTDLYGIQVIEDDKGYAIGLVDDIKNLKINLYKNKTYKFVVSLIRDAKNKLYNQGDNWILYYKDGYWPYLQYNSFLYGTWNIMEYLRRGKVQMQRKSSTGIVNPTFYYPETDRFYGELSGYTPTVNGTANIELKRTAFGLRYEIENLTDGSISLNVSKTFTDDNDEITETFIDETGITESETEGRIFTFKDVYSCWQLADDYSESVTVSISWLRDIGVEVPLGSVNVQVKRNVMNVLNINLAASDGDATIGITTEDDSSMTGEGVEVPLE